MNGRKLERDLELPGMQGSLIAYRSAADKPRWYVRFFASGPDRRYSPGIAIVPSNKLPLLVDAIDKALDKMAELHMKKEYLDDYSEEYIRIGEVSDSLSVEVLSKRSRFLFWSFKNIKLNFIIHSKTNGFVRSVNLNEAGIVLFKLSSAESLSASMIEQLG
jgi:hypothetical protein